MEEAFLENCVVSVKPYQPEKYGTSTHNRDNLNITERIDPKPLKSKPEELLEYSCSGILVHPSKGLVLTSGQAFTKFVKQRPRIFSQFSTRPHHHHWFQSRGTAPRNIQYFAPKDLGPLSIQVGVAKRKESRARNSSSSESKFAVFDAEVIVLWKCQEFADEVQRLFPAKDDWHFADEAATGPGSKWQRGKTTNIWDDEQDQQFVEPVGMSSASKKETVENFVSWMTLLKIKKTNTDYQKYRKPFLHSASSLHQGDPLYLCGTPFGSMCPSVFLNSVSKGVVTNTSGPENVLVMTDARCMPGSEGGGVYIIPRYESSKRRRLVAMIVAPLCWKTNEWIGLSLACSVQSVLKSLRPLVHWDSNDEPFVCVDDIQKGLHVGGIKQCMQSIVLVRVGGVWGSGVILDRSEGIIVTCYHVIKNAKNNEVQIRLDRQQQWQRHWLSAEILYSTGPNSTYDLAFLKLQNSEDKALLHGLPTACLQHYQKGSPVFVIGHALFGPGASMSPSVTSGVMSKVISIGHQSIMLQSSCAVHSGASGGALVCGNTGALLGIVCSNSRDTDTGASFPHINFSIPMAVIHPVLHQYLSTKDVNTFQQLANEDSKVKALWHLEETNDKWVVSEITSKL